MRLIFYCLVFAVSFAALLEGVEKRGKLAMISVILGIIGLMLTTVLMVLELTT